MNLLQTVKSLLKIAPSEPPPSSDDPETTARASVLLISASKTDLQARIRAADALDARRRKERSNVKEILARSDLSGVYVFFETRWLDQWNEFLTGGTPPGVISFGALLGQGGQVNPATQLERDYKIIPKEIWSYLESTYDSEPPLESSIPDITTVLRHSDTQSTQPLQVPEDSQMTEMTETTMIHAGRQTVRGLVGLHNPELFCYMNASVQFLMSAEPFRDYLIEKSYQFHCTAIRKPFCEALSDAAINLFSSSPSLVRPVKLWAVSQRKFCPQKMHDAQEFIHYILDSVDTELAIPRKTGIKSDLISTCFAGQLRSEMKCINCGVEKQVGEQFLELAIPMSKSVKSGLKVFSARETIPAAYDCGNCGVKTDVAKTMKIERCPEFLVISVKRFKQSPNTEKSSAFVKFRKRLMLPW